MNHQSMMQKNLSIAAIFISFIAIAMVLSEKLNWGPIDEVPEPPLPKVGTRIKIRERHFGPNDPNNGETTTDFVHLIDFKNDKVLLQTDLGYKVLTTRNPFMPSLEEEATGAEKYKFSNTIFGDVMDIFPLRVGKRVEHKITGDSTLKGGQTWQYDYMCEVEAKEKIYIALGTFDTLRVVCRAEGSKNYKQTYYYSPHHGFVLLTKKEGDSYYFNEVQEIIPAGQ